MYPKRLLTSHFWTDEQKREFRNSYMSERLKNSSPLVKSLQYHVKDIKDTKVIPKWTGVMQLLQGGRQPSVQQLIECKHLFVTGPYSFSNLHFAHRVSFILLITLHLQSVVSPSYHLFYIIYCGGKCIFIFAFASWHCLILPIILHLQSLFSLSYL